MATVALVYMPRVSGGGRDWVTLSWRADIGHCPSALGIYPEKPAFLFVAHVGGAQVSLDLLVKNIIFQFKNKSSK